MCDDCACGGATLGELERRVMDVLWQQPEREFTGRDVANAFSEHAYTTVATVLNRLVAKSLVRRRMDGGKVHFSAVGSQGTHAAVLMRQAMSVGADADAALASFARSLSPSEAATLREALNAVEREPAESAS
jgi:predicted transcriptional regulator